MPPSPGALPSVVHQPGPPFPPQVGGRQPGHEAGVLRGDLALVIIAIQRPGLHLAARQPAIVQHAMERMQVVVALGADRVQRVFQPLRG